MPRGDLFPEIGPYETGLLPLSAPHVMYWEQVGNPEGAPVLFLHGGPGAGAGAVHRRFCDPLHGRLVVCDQRGSRRPPTHKRREPRIRQGTTGTCVRVAIMNAPCLNGSSPGASLNVPSAKTASELPFSTRRM